MAHHFTHRPGKLPYFAAIVILLLTGLTVSAATLKVPEQFEGIQPAIDAANSGDTVLVSPGKYPAPVRLKPGVILRSAGNDRLGKVGLARAEATVIDGTIAVVGGEAEAGVLMAEGAVLDGFTVTGIGKYDDALWKRHHATRGIEQEHEHIGGFGAPGVGIDGVTCRVVNNIVHHIGHTGIAVRGAEGETVAPLVSGNTCFRNMGGGIGLMNGASGIVSSNKCFENFYAGIGHSGASPLVVGNTCYENIRAGIGISEGACPIVRGNRCYQNRRAGIGTRTGGNTKPVIEDNDCYANGMAGIGTDEGAAPLIRGNRCYENELAGIGSRDGAKPVIIGNKVFRNKAAGIGFEACEGGVALVHDNTVEENAMVAVGVHSGWMVTFTDNRLSTAEGMPPGVMVFEGAEAMFSGNTISTGGVAGIRVAGNVEVVGNRFIGKALRKGGPPQFAIWALEGSRVNASGNRMNTWRHGLFASGAEVNCSGNRIEEFHQFGFVVDNPSARALITGNTAVSEDPDADAVSIRNDSHESYSAGNSVVAEP